MPEYFGTDERAKLTEELAIYDTRRYSKPRRKLRLLYIERMKKQEKIRIMMNKIINQRQL